MKFEYHLDERQIEYDVEGEAEYGSEKILLHEDDNLIAGTAWKDAGYTVTRFLEDPDYFKLIEGISLFVKRIAESVLKRDLPDLRLEKYHEAVRSDEAHYEIVRRTYHNNNSIHDLPIDPRLIINRISEICGIRLISKGPQVAPVFHLRIHRPHSKDNNPLHRDVWLDRLRNAVNIYVPIAGSNHLSSLVIVPGSHFWQESEICRTKEGARINGLVYTVPTVVGVRRDLIPVRPNPGWNEVLVFSPYLIHGGAINLNPDSTRVSMEMRFWRE